MDNLDKIKYKEAGNSWFIKIFLNDKGNEVSRTPSFADGKGAGTGLFKEMKAWVEAGNKIESQFTAEELAEKEKAESDTAAISWIGERETEYIKEGCTEKELIVALWEKVVENRPESADALEVKRQAVKERIIKPE
ncbi:hypothetical protein KAR91_77015 [Candidatus Pacearchaeota archaeon]|nr:hypothetical protein [Candidatus Pacearchaeota archaeon]